MVTIMTVDLIEGDANFLKKQATVVQGCKT